jgi:uncharacterized protein YukE
MTATPDVPPPAGGYRNAPVCAPTPDWTTPGAPSTPDLSGALVVDSDALKRAALLLGEVADRARAASAGLDSAVRQAGPAPWGDDTEIGQTFGQSFAQPAEQLREAVQQLPEVLRQLADSLQRAHTGFQDADQQAAEVAARRPDSRTG